MNPTNISNKYRGELSDLAKLIKSWNLINENSSGNLEPLAQKLLDLLHRESDQIKIKYTIESELCITYGLYKTEFDADHLAIQVLNWWSK